MKQQSLFSFEQEQEQEQEQVQTQEQAREPLVKLALCYTDDEPQGPYPPEPRLTYCCSAVWHWNGQQYCCKKCG